MKSSLLNLTYEIELKSGEKFSLPEALVESIGEGRWIITVRPADSTPPIRNHSAFLSSYGPEDEGLYDDDVEALTPDAEAAIAKGFYNTFLDSYGPEDEGLYDGDTAR